MPRRNLVVVRAGDNSLHPHWLKGESSRNWDMVVSYFGDDPDLYKAEDLFRIDGKGPKWQGLHELFANHQEFRKDYDYILLPDDDLMMSKEDINRLFDICKAHGLEVGHPALTWNSYYSHLITLRKAGMRLRYTNFVELMAVCLSNAMFDKTWGYFAKTLSGWGLDQAWAKLAGPMKMALIDEVAVRHTRPVGGPNHQVLRDKNISPWDEMRDFCREIGVDETPVIETYGAVVADGRRIDRARHDRLFDFRMLGCCLAALMETPQPKTLARGMADYSYNVLRKLPERLIEQASKRRDLDH
jgi:hypothetical protein